MLYQHFVRKEIPTTVIYINLYIKSLKSLENKIALLKVNKEDGLDVPKKFYPKDVRKNSPHLLNTFIQSPIKDLVDQRDSIEHSINKLSEIIVFFCKKDTYDKSVLIQFKKLEKVMANIDNSHYKIHHVLFPEIKKYIVTDN